MFNRLYQYFHTNEILAPEQFSFRKESNIEKAIFSLTDSVLSLNLRQQIGGIFCDLSNLDLQKKIDFTLHYISDWFSFSGLTLNMEKTNMVKFCTNHSLNNKQHRPTDNYLINEVTNIRFLGLELNNNTNWKNHVAKILPKWVGPVMLSEPCTPLAAWTRLRWFISLTFIW